MLARSVATALTILLPGVSALPTVRVQLPSAPTTALPTLLPSMLTTTVAPTSPVPVMVGVVSAVIAFAVGEVIARVVLVSTLKLRVLLDMPPRPSVPVAVTVYAPSGSAAPGVNVHAPVGSAVTVLTLVPIVMVTTMFGSELPVMAGVESPVRVASAGVSMRTSRRQLLLQPSPATALPSSQLSIGAPMTVSPHAVTQVLGSPVQLKPGSMVQVAEQPSPGTKLSSSHASPGSRPPSPQPGIR